MKKFIEVHTQGIDKKRLYINPAAIFAVGEDEDSAVIFYNNIRSPEFVTESYDMVKMRIIEALED